MLRKTYRISRSCFISHQDIPSFKRLAPLDCRCISASTSSTSTSTNANNVEKTHEQSQAAQGSKGALRDRLHGEGAEMSSGQNVGKGKSKSAFVDGVAAEEHHLLSKRTSHTPSSQSKTKRQPRHPNPSTPSSKVKFPKIAYAKSSPLALGQPRPQTDVMELIRYRNELVQNFDPTIHDERAFQEAVKIIERRIFSFNPADNSASPTTSDTRRGRGSPPAKHTTSKVTTTSNAKPNKPKGLLPVLKENENRRVAIVRSGPLQLSQEEADAKIGLDTELYGSNFASGKDQGWISQHTKRRRYQTVAQIIEGIEQGRMEQTGTRSNVRTTKGNRNWQEHNERAGKRKSILLES